MEQHQHRCHQDLSGSHHWAFLGLSKRHNFSKLQREMMSYNTLSQSSMPKFWLILLVFGRNDSHPHITGNASIKKKQELRMRSRQLCLPVFFRRSCSRFLSFVLHWSCATLSFLPLSTILVRSLTRDWQFLWLSWHCLRFPPSTTLPFSHVALLCWHLFRSSLLCCTALLSALISPFCLFFCKVEVWRN